MTVWFEGSDQGRTVLQTEVTKDAGYLRSKLLARDHIAVDAKGKMVADRSRRDEAALSLVSRGTIVNDTGGPFPELDP